MAELYNEQQLLDAVKLVENFFRKVNIDPDKQHAKMNNAYRAWYIRRGSALIYIILHAYPNANTVRVASPLVYLPDDNLLPFYRQLLERNFNLPNCSLAVDKDLVILLNERNLQGLDDVEFEESINLISINADDLDDHFSKTFGAKKFNN